MLQPNKATRLALFLFSSTLLLAQTPPPAQAAARKGLDLLLAGKYPDLTALFSETMKKTVTLDFLKDKVSAELKEFGTPQKVGEPILGADGASTLVSFPVQFSNTSIHVQFALNPANELTGMYFRPPNKPLPFQWSRPAYSKPESFQERELVVGDDNWKLPATLTLPVNKTRVPGIVLVHGPGPNDRNETLFATRIFEDLAEGLSTRGFAVLRYDKRTKIFGEEMSQSAWTLDQETTEDAVRAIALLRKQPEVDPARIYILGHSLGGYAAPRIAKQDGKLAGLILLAGVARPIEDLAMDQTQYLAHLKGEPGVSEQKRLDQLQAEVEKVKKLDPKATDNPPIVLGLPSDWWLNVQGYDPPAEAKKLGLPVLVLQGERDFQVTNTNFELWKTGLTGNAKAAFHSYPDMNNLFMTSDKKEKPSPAEYHVPGNVAPEVIEEIATWLAAQK